MEEVYNLLKTELALTENSAAYLDLNGEFGAASYLNASVLRLDGILAKVKAYIKLQKEEL